MDFREELNLYILNAEKNLSDITKSLGWSPKNSEESLNTDYQFCPINKEHRVPKIGIKKHIEKCSLMSQGYSLDDDFLQPIDADMMNKSSVLVLDKYKQQKVLTEALKKNRNLNISTHLREPSLTFDRYLCDFTPDERYVLYDYAIEHTSTQNKPFQNDLNIEFDVTTKNKKTGPQTLQELLSAERDSKRRRLAYRKRNGQNGKKSDTESLRELIQSQMEYFYNKNDDDNFSEDKNSPLKIQWKYGKRFNVKNYFRQWEFMDSDNEIMEKTYTEENYDHTETYESNKPSIRDKFKMRLPDDSRYKMKSPDSHRYIRKSSNDTKYEMKTDNYKHKTKSYHDSRYETRSPDSSRYKTKSIDNYRYKRKSPNDYLYKTRSPDDSKYKTRPLHDSRCETGSPENTRYKPDSHLHKRKSSHDSRYEMKSTDNTRYESSSPDRHRYNTKSSHSSHYKTNSSETNETKFSYSSRYKTNSSDYDHNQKKLNKIKLKRKRSKHRNNSYNSDSYSDNSDTSDKLNNLPAAYRTDGKSNGYRTDEKQKYIREDEYFNDEKYEKIKKSKKCKHKKSKKMKK